ncbi:MAG TPA: heavy metal-binding domain-containing protein, partial [Xanthomonadaceae bacterium]|nr:heavy metal-binding domain-containing protein [Xanthomonadaceae bacterium]
MITCAFELPGQRIIKNLGIARGIIVRSRSIVGSVLGGLQTLFGGNITIYTQLCEQARIDAFDLMCRDAHRLAANAIIGM